MVFTTLLFDFVLVFETLRCFHNAPFTVFLRAEVIFLPQFKKNCGIFFYVLYKLIKSRRHALDTKPFRRSGISIPPMELPRDIIIR